MKRYFLLLLLTVVTGTGVGCGGGTLETGYAYTPLGDSSAKRRGYYADPFSPEAQSAQAEHQTEMQSRRPNLGQ